MLECGGYGGLPSWGPVTTARQSVSSGTGRKVRVLVVEMLKHYSQVSKPEAE